jgi:hypothetical protein
MATGSPRADRGRAAAVRDLRSLAVARCDAQRAQRGGKSNGNISRVQTADVGRGAARAAREIAQAQRGGLSVDADARTVGLPRGGLVRFRKSFAALRRTSSVCEPV